MSLQPEQLLIASVVGYEPCGPDEASERPESPAAETALICEPFASFKLNLLSSDVPIFNQVGKF